MTYRAEDWKPGDIARCPQDDAVVMKAAEGSDWWHSGYSVPQSLGGLNLRRLVVIDPEDREQVERLIHLYRMQSASLRDADAYANALREFAAPTPPKPDEPLGLGAVVEDAEGARWVRTAWTGDGGPWESRAGRAGLYANIAAVKVLSEGVTS